MDPNDVLRSIVRGIPRYTLEAYFFVFRALSFAANSLEQATTPAHVTGQDLLLAIRDLAVREFGFLGKLVFNAWGVHTTIDWGHIVFNLVDRELMGTTEDDKLGDFSEGFDFREAFETNVRIEIDPR